MTGNEVNSGAAKNDLERITDLLRSPLLWFVIALYGKTGGGNAGPSGAGGRSGFHHFHSV